MANQDRPRTEKLANFWRFPHFPFLELPRGVAQEAFNIEVGTREMNAALSPAEHDPFGSSAMEFGRFFHRPPPSWDDFKLIHQPSWDDIKLNHHKRRR